MRNIFDLISLLSGAIGALCLWALFITAQVQGISPQMPKHGEHSVIPAGRIPRAIHQVQQLEGCLAISILVFAGSRIRSRQLAWRDPNTVV